MGQLFETFAFTFGIEESLRRRIFETIETNVSSAGQFALKHAQPYVQAGVVLAMPFVCSVVKPIANATITTAQPYLETLQEKCPTTLVTYVSQATESAQILALKAKDYATAIQDVPMVG